MRPIFKNIIAVIAGLVVGGSLNMLIIMMSGSVIPLPEGIDPTNLESLEEGMHLFQAKHFVLPFLAHALGTLAGGYLAAVIAASHKMKLSMLIGAFFLAGGIANAFMLPAPTWFIIVDLTLAYIPMAFIGGRLAQSKKARVAPA